LPEVLIDNSSGSEPESTEGDTIGSEREWSTEVVSGKKQPRMNEGGREGDRKDGVDSGRGPSPNPSMIDMMQLFLVENKRRDDENRRRDEMDRLRRDEDNRRREDELRRQETERERREESIRLQREDEARRREEKRRQQEAERVRREEASRAQ